jgi:hypothetical protein
MATAALDSSTLIRTQSHGDHTVTLVAQPALGMRVEIFHLSFGMYMKTTPSIITTEHGTTRFLQCHLIDSAYADHKTRSRPSAPRSQLIELADRFMSVFEGWRQAHGLLRCHLPDRRCKTCGSHCAAGTGCERERQKSSLSVILRDTRKHGSIMLKRYNHASSSTVRLQNTCWQRLRRTFCAHRVKFEKKDMHF